MQLHEPGECPDRAYGRDCDGVGHWQEDPFAADINDDHSKHWICDGVAYGSAMDI